MTQPDFLLEQNERTQRYQTTRRREGRSRRKSTFLLIGLALVGLFILGGPSLISYSSIGNSMVGSQLSQYGFDGGAESVRIGWVTPLKLEQLNVRGESGATALSIDRIDVDVTVADLLLGRSDARQITARGVNLACQVSEGRFSIEDDLHTVLNQPSSGESSSFQVELVDVTATIKDAITGDVWKMAQAAADFDIDGGKTEASFTGVLTEPGDSGGALQGSLKMLDSGVANDQWQLSLRGDSLPLSIVSILRRRFSEMTDAIPSVVRGDATGEVVLAAAENGAVDASVRSLRIRNLSALDIPVRSDPNSQPPEPVLLWNNSLATINGELTLTEHRLIGRRLQATADFGKATIDGAFSRDFSWVGTADNPLRWLDGIDGVASVDLDLPKLQTALPGILPIRDDAKLMSGRATARVKSLPPEDRNEIRRSELSIHSDAIRGRSRAQSVVIDPIDVTAIVASDRDRVRADSFRWSSSFGQAVGQGDLRSGHADIQIDFGRLTAMLRPVIDLSNTEWSGNANGEIRWDASKNDEWRLTGKGEANDLIVSMPGGQKLNRRSVRGQLEAVGQWGIQNLRTLSYVSAGLESDTLSIKAELLDAVHDPSIEQMMPVGVVASGKLETLREVVGPWLPISIHQTDGDFDFVARSHVSSNSIDLHVAELRVRELELAVGDRSLRQSELKGRFEGSLIIPDFDQTTMRVIADRCNIMGEGFAADLSGSLAIVDSQPTETKLDVKWNADLLSLQGRVDEQIAKQITGIQQVGFQSNVQMADASHWVALGNCHGECQIVKDGQWIQVTHETVGKEMALLQPIVAQYQSVGPMQPTARNNPKSGFVDRTNDRSRQEDVSSRVSWFEPNLNLSGVVRLNPKTGEYIARDFDIAGDWFATALDGEVVWNQQTLEVHLKGPARLKMDEVGRLLSPRVGTKIELTGIHETPIALDLVQPQSDANQEMDFHLKADLGWETAQIAGLTLGETRVPIEMTPTTVLVAPAKIPIGRGFVRAAGKINYRPGTAWIELDPGLLAESVELTPEMTDRWLKYLAPLAANTARIRGTISAKISDAVIVLDDPARTRLVGQIDLSGVEMTAGPLANQLIGGVGQLTSLTGLLGSKTVSSAPDQTLLTMPPQTTDFTIDRGIVSHERLFFNIDRAQIITSGNVNMNGQLNLIAQIPLDARWLGRDLQGLAGQTVTLPIDGTLSRPSLDSSGVAKVAGELGVKAIEQTTENYLQKQMERGLDKIFGR